MIIRNGRPVGCVSMQISHRALVNNSQAISGGVWIAIIALSVITVNVSEWSEGDQRGSRLSGISSETFRFGEIWEDV